MEVKDYVFIPSINEYGLIIKIRFDDRNEPIFTVSLDDCMATPDGLYYARRHELIL